jgi:F-type H+-transporting ATPase subunit delta
MTPENRKKLWRAVLGGKAEPLVLRFIEFIIDKGRNPTLAEIIEAFTRLYNEEKNILAVEIRAARELEQSQVDAITQRLTQRFSKTIKPTIKIDPSLIGGFQVRVGDVVYDYSINHQLDTLHRRLITA